MRHLSACTAMLGADTLIDSDPSQEICYGAIYRPFDPALWLSDPEWGVFTPAGKLIDAGAYCRLPVKYRVGQSETVSLAHWTVQDAPEADYVYCGPVILHYGHFITAFLPRLWQIVREGIGPGTKFVCHSDHDPYAWFARDYAREMLAALGLSADRFVRPGGPTRFRRLRFPRPAFEEQNFAHVVFRELALKIGQSIPPPSGRTGPVYLSKTALRQGTYKLANELAIEDAVAARGVTIIRPETLPFRRQCEVIAAASAIVGTIGSSFHTVLFCREPPRIVGLAYSATINSNYHLIDRLAGVNASYVTPSGGLSERPQSGVTFGYWLDSPGEVANELLDLL